MAVCGFRCSGRRVTLAAADRLINMLTLALLRKCCARLIVIVQLGLLYGLVKIA